MTKRRAWLTPNADEGAVTIVRPLFIPLPFLPMVAGALAELTNEWNWEQSGTVTPSGAAEAMSSMLFQWIDAGVGAMSLFRFTEECAFEFSNDNGVTWLVVPGWNEYAATCFDSGPAITATVVNELAYDQPPALNFNASTKTLTLDMPVGEPPEQPAITATVVNELAYDQPPALNFNAITKTLTLDVPVGEPPEQPAITATVVNELAYDQPPALNFNAITKTLTLDVPVGEPPEQPAITATVVNELAYDQPPALNFNAITKTLTLDIPVGGPPTPPTGALEDIPFTGLSDEQICGMVTYVMVELQREWDQLIEELNVASDAAEAIGEMIEWFYAAGIPIVFQMFVDGVTTAFTVGAATMQAQFTPQIYDAMQEKMYCLFKAAGTWDGSVISLWWEWAVTEWPLVNNFGAWWFAEQTQAVDIGWLKRKAYLGTLDPLATCVLYDCAPDGWEYAVDFTQEAGAWIGTAFNGCTTTRTSDGWQPCNPTQDIKITLPSPGGFDANRTIDEWSVTYRATEPGRSGTAIQMVMQMVGAPSPGFNHDGTTDIKTATVTGPWTGFNALTPQGFFIEILSATVKGPTSPHPWE